MESQESQAQEKKEIKEKVSAKEVADKAGQAAAVGLEKFGQFSVIANEALEAGASKIIGFVPFLKIFEKIAMPYLLLSSVVGGALCVTEHNMLAFLVLEAPIVFALVSHLRSKKAEPKE